VYSVDCAGALVPEGVRARVEAVAARVGAVGFHAHDNLGLAIGNTVAAIEAGASQVDGCLRGLGAGAGNAATELLAAVLDRMGIASGLDVFALSDAAEHVVRPLMPFQPFPDRESLAIGYAGVYSTFLLHAKRRGERLGLRTPDDSVSLTWAQYAARVRSIAAGLAARDVGDGDTVALLLANRPEFHLIDTASIHLGAVPFSVYQTNPAEQIAHQLANS